MAKEPRIPTQTRRTTPSLVTTALEGANKAGKRVIAADVRSGGVVRIFFVEPGKAQIGEDTTCDDIFEAGSDCNT